MFERYEQKLVVFVFYGRFHEKYEKDGLPIVFVFYGHSFRVFSSFIAHSFWVSAGFACLERTLTCLRDMTRNSPISRFMAVFRSSCPQFRGSRAIYSDLPT